MSGLDKFKKTAPSEDAPINDDFVIDPAQNPIEEFDHLSLISVLNPLMRHLNQLDMEMDHLVQSFMRAWINNDSKQIDAAKAACAAQYRNIISFMSTISDATPASTAGHLNYVGCHVRLVDVNGTHLTYIEGKYSPEAYNTICHRASKAMGLAEEDSYEWMSRG